LGSGIEQKLKFSSSNNDKEYSEREGGEFEEKEFIDSGETKGSQT